MTDYYLNEYTLAKALYMIIPAVVNIDGGCPPCIGGFTNEVNDIFKMANQSVEFVYDEDDDDQPVKVRIFDEFFKPKTQEVTNEMDSD